MPFQQKKGNEGETVIKAEKREADVQKIQQHAPALQDPCDAGHAFQTAPDRMEKGNDSRAKGCIQLEPAVFRLKVPDKNAGKKQKQQQPDEGFRVAENQFFCPEFKPESADGDEAD